MRKHNHHCHHRYVHYTNPVIPFKPRLGCINATSILHIPEHRSGWAHVGKLLQSLHDPSGPVLVDFAENMWLWGQHENESQDKWIHYKSVSHVIRRQDLKMIDGREHAVLPNGDAVMWKEGSWRESTESAKDIEKADEYGVFTKHWVAFIHNPPVMPEFFDIQNSPYNLVTNHKFKKSLLHCRGLFVFSEYLRKYLLEVMPAPLPIIEVVRHPTMHCDKKWSVDKFRQVPKKLVQVGYWLRKITSIWIVDIPDNWSRAWVNRSPTGLRLLEAEIYAEKQALKVALRNVDVVQLDDEEYDRVLATCVVLLDMYDSSVNNTLIECVVRHTPIICKRLPATIEYLHEDYCLFFDDLSEVSAMLGDERLLLKARDQLKAIEQSGILYASHFVTQMANSSILQPRLNGKVVSLGLDCMPRVMATKFGFKARKMQGELSMPFDLVATSYDGLVLAIGERLCRFLDKTELFVNESAKLAHRSYQIHFNHESKDLLNYIINDYDKWMDVFSRRVTAFQDALAAESVVFILHYNGNPTELVDAIRNAYPALQFTILVISTPKPSIHNRQESVAGQHFVREIIPLPWDEYVWHKDYCSKFEENIRSFLQRHIDPIHGVDESGWN